MHKENFEKLKDDPLVYYIYNIGLSIFGISAADKYLVIVDDTYKIEFDPSNEVDVYFKTKSEWFQEILDCKLLP